MKTAQFQQTLKVCTEVDVAVIGAGPAGCCAAIASARAGYTTVIIEQSGFAGGMATAGLVGPILGMYHWDSGKRILGGIPYQILKEMERRGGAELSNDGMLVPFDPEIMKSVLDRFLKFYNVQVCYHTRFVHAIKENNTISHIVIANGEGLSAVKAKIYIDSTGNGDVAAASGVPFIIGSSGVNTLQPMTTVFRIGGINTSYITNSENPKTGYVATEIRDILLQAEMKGIVPAFGGPWIMRGSTLREGEAFVNTVRQWGDPTQPEELSRCEIDGREDMFQLFEYMKQQIPAMKESYIIDSGSSIGIRDSRHFSGQFILSLEDCTSMKNFDDSIALGGHIVDIHSPEGSSDQLRKTIPIYEIPYRTLLVNEIDNLMLAGRAISVEYEVFASVRVMATCMAIGQGAGEATAIALKHKLPLNEIPIPELSNHLERSGVIRARQQAI